MLAQWGQKPDVQRMLKELDIPGLNSALGSTDAELRRSATRALYRLAGMKVGDESSVQLLSKCLSDGDAVVRWNASEALSALNGLLEERKREGS